MANVVNTITNTLSTTGVNQTLSTTGVNESYQVGDITMISSPTDQYQMATLASTATSSFDLMEVIDQQELRILELEKLVKLLVAEVLPERSI